MAEASVDERAVEMTDSLSVSFSFSFSSLSFLLFFSVSECRRARLFVWCFSFFVVDGILELAGIVGSYIVRKPKKDCEIRKVVAYQ